MVKVHLLSVSHCSQNWEPFVYFFWSFVPIYELTPLRAWPIPCFRSCLGPSLDV